MVIDIPIHMSPARYPAVINIYTNFIQNYKNLPVRSAPLSTLQTPLCLKLHSQLSKLHSIYSTLLHRTAHRVWPPVLQVNRESCQSLSELSIIREMCVGSTVSRLVTM